MCSIFVRSLSKSKELSTIFSKTGQCYICLFNRMNFCINNKNKTEDENVAETFSGYIPENKLDITYCRSSGPGGQHANKSNTKVDVRFHLPSADWISCTIKRRLLEKTDIKLTKDNFLVIKSEETRFAHLNLEKALNRLREIINEAAHIKTAELSPDVQAMLADRKIKAAAKRIERKRYRSMLHQSRNFDDF